MNVCLCLFQVGDYHPDLNVRNLHNHHEVSLFLFLSHFQPVGHRTLKTHLSVCVCVVCVCVVSCVGSTDPCTAWWRDTAAGQGSRAWAVCDGRLLWEASETVTTTWCRWSQVRERVFVRVRVYIQNIKKFPQSLSSVQQTQWHILGCQSNPLLSPCGFPTGWNRTRPLSLPPSLCPLCLIKLSSPSHFYLPLTSPHPLSPDSCVVAGQDSGVVMVDEMLNLNPHQLSFSEASLRLLITPHFPPFTRLRMAGCMVINEVHCTRSHPSHNVRFPWGFSARLVGI